MNILIQFDDQNLSLAACIGQALVAYGNGATATPEWARSVPEGIGDTLKKAEQVLTETAETVTDNGPGMTGLDRETEVGPEEQAARDAGTVTIEATIGVPADQRLDQHGVAFDPKYCADAKDPFYGSGKYAGQWKRRRGVSEDTYYDWYASVRPEQVQKVAEPDAPVDTAAAFAKTQPEQPAEPVTFTDAGQFMHWCAEQTAAGNITSEQVTAAYAAVGVTVADMFPPADEATIMGHVAAIHKVLVA